MKKAISIMIFFTLVFTGFTLFPISVSANTVETSTIYFEGELTYDDTGYIGVLPCVVDGIFDIFAEEGASAWFGDDPGTGEVWTEQVIGADHDAWPSWNPDTPDWYQYSIKFYEDSGVYYWALRNHPGATEANPWYDDAYWITELPPMGVPMSGVMDWYSELGGYAEETDTGAYLPATGTAEIPGGAAGYGGGPQAWDMDWSWGSEVVPLEYPGFEVIIEEIDEGVYGVSLVPAPNEPATIDKTMSATEGELGDIVTITIDFEIPEGISEVLVYDYLPWGFEYVVGSYMIGGIAADPVAYDDDFVVDYFTTSGIYQITFDAKIVEAKSWEEIEVINSAVIYWKYVAVWTYLNDDEPFTILPFEELHKNVGITKADVVFAIDLTGSMSEEISTIKSQATNIMNSLAAQITDVQFGLISFMDYVGTYSTTEPGSDPVTYSATYGYTGDYPYLLDQDITDSIATMTTAINSLTIGDGGDGPQDYSRIIYESYQSDLGPSWRANAERFLILFGDNVPHDTNFDYDNDGTLENAGGDPGRDTTIGTLDDLDFETEVANAAAAGVHILGIYSGLTSWKYPWTYMASETNGGYYELAAAEDLPDAINDLIKKAAEKTLTITEKTKVHWPVYIDVVNPFDTPMMDTKIYDRFGGEIMIDNITAGDTTYEFTYDNYHKKNAKVTINDGSTDIIPNKPLDKDGVTLGEEPYEFNIYWTGTSHKIHFEWSIGTIYPDEFIGIIIGASTDQNPKGKQEYTTPGTYELNSGATLKFYESSLSLVETVNVDSTISDPTPGLVNLEEGVEYIIKATGTANAGDGIEFDAKYSFRTPSSTEWTDYVSTYESYGPDLLDLYVDGINVDWGDYNEDHTYYYIYTGTGVPIELLINDIDYLGNAGSLTVEIYQAQAEDILLSAYTDSVYVEVLPE